MRHPLWHRMTSEERLWLVAFDKWHERGERSFVAMAASKEARRFVDACRWAKRNDVTKHLSRASNVDLGRMASERGWSRTRAVSAELTARLKALTPGSGRRKAPPLSGEQRRLRETLAAIARLA